MSNIEALLVVVKRLGALRSRVVFVGGSVRELLITDEAAPPERPTDVPGDVASQARLPLVRARLEALTHPRQ